MNFETYWNQEGIRLLGDTPQTHIPTLEDRCRHAFNAGRKACLEDLTFKLDDHFNRGHHEGTRSILLYLMLIIQNILDGFKSVPDTEERE